MTSLLEDFGGRFKRKVGILGFSKGWLTSLNFGGREWVLRNKFPTGNQKGSFNYLGLVGGREGWGFHYWLLKEFGPLLFRLPGVLF